MAGGVATAGEGVGDGVGAGEGVVGVGDGVGAGEGSGEEVPPELLPLVPPPELLL